MNICACTVNICCMHSMGHLAFSLASDRAMTAQTAHLPSSNGTAHHGGKCFQTRSRLARGQSNLAGKQLGTFQTEMNSVCSHLMIQHVDDARTHLEQR
jgi:hypothetical protein